MTNAGYRSRSSSGPDAKTHRGTHLTCVGPAKGAIVAVVTWQVLAILRSRLDVELHGVAAALGVAVTDGATLTQFASRLDGPTVAVVMYCNELGAPLGHFTPVLAVDGTVAHLVVSLLRMTLNYLNPTAYDVLEARVDFDRSRSTC